VTLLLLDSDVNVVAGGVALLAPAAIARVPFVAAFAFAFAVAVAFAHSYFDKRRVRNAFVRVDGLIKFRCYFRFVYLLCVLP